MNRTDGAKSRHSLFVFLFISFNLHWLLLAISSKAQYVANCKLHLTLLKNRSAAYARLFEPLPTLSLSVKFQRHYHSAGWKDGGTDTTYAYSASYPFCHRCIFLIINACFLSCSIISRVMAAHRGMCREKSQGWCSPWVEQTTNKDIKQMGSVLE